MGKKLDIESSMLRAMPTKLKNDELAFNAALFDRVKSIRESKDWTAEQMATALGIPAERYRKYENRTPIPHYLIPRIALLSGRSPEWVLTGKEARTVAATNGKVR
jgi:DNA-binding XRE family transcriptional regulator